MPRIVRCSAAFIAILGLVAIGVVALLMTVELTLPLDAYRDRIAAALSRASGMEVRLAGPMRLFTGRRSGIELDGLQVAGATGQHRWQARADRVRVRLSIVGLIFGEIRVYDTLVAGAVICGNAGSSPGTAARSPSEAPVSVPAGWSVAGIDRIRFERIAFVNGEPCERDRALAEIASLEATVPARDPTRVAARGGLRGADWNLTLDGPGLTKILGGDGPAPFKLAGEFAGARFTASPFVTRKPLSVRSDLTLESAELATLLKPLGAPILKFGPALLRARVEAGDTRLALRVDEARIDLGTTTGELSVDWSGPRPRLSVQVSTNVLDAIDVYAWLLAALDFDRIDPSEMVQRLIAAARESEGKLAATSAQVVAGKFIFDAVKVEGRWQEGVASASIAGNLGGAPVSATVSADVSSEEVALAAAARANGVTLPQGLAVSGTVGGVDIKGSTSGPLGPALSDKLQAIMALREVELAQALRDGAGESLRLDSARAEILTGGALRLAFSGLVLGEQYSARLEGEDMRKLLKGEPWPARASGAFGPLRLTAAGDIALQEGKPRAALELSAVVSMVSDLSGKLRLFCQVT